jgi:hypothetical protein
MKQLKMWIVLVVLVLFEFTSYAQRRHHVVVTVQPPRPKTVIVVPAPPSPRHVWVEEDWTPRGKVYEWHGGYYVEPPRPTAVWVPGHWKKRGHGWYWVPGRWKVRR